MFAVMRTYLSKSTGCGRPLKADKCKSAFLCPNLKKFDDGSTATIYETESQLFPKKCEVKLHKHSNHIAGKSRNFLKNGQDP
jgi:hypothetical protein